MKLTETKLKDVFIVEPTVFSDSRGWFMETYSHEKMKSANLDINFVQDNHSFSNEIGTLRGLHFQLDPKAQTKLVRCLHGRILDVAVDLRKGSPTYLHHVSVELSSENKLQLLIPKGFAHGFVTLTPNCEVAYKVDEYYSKEHDRSIFYNDPILNIDWTIQDVILSEKDSNALLLSLSDVDFTYKEDLK